MDWSPYRSRERLRALFLKVVTPERMLVGGFVALILLGTLLLKMPFSTQAGSIRTIDALFTATSAVCVTGLTVLDTGRDFTLIGQIIILCLIQLGGLGIMTFSVLFFELLGGKVSLRQKMAFESSFSPSPLRDVLSVSRQIIGLAFFIEAIGALLLFLRWAGSYPFGKALYLSAFHSISAFCNAGFSPFSDSLRGYARDWSVNLIVAGLIVLGGLGFLVLMDLKGWRPKRGLSLHSKIVLSATSALVLFGTVFFMVTEDHTVLQGLPFGQRLLISLFQSITARTAGFCTVDIGGLSDGGLFLLSILMFIGASPGSCGGGIKTTNFAILFFLVYNRLKGRTEAVAFKRTVPPETVTRSISLTIGSFLFLSAMLFISLVNQRLFCHQPTSFLQVLFELVSAFGTVGLSTGITPALGDFGKAVLIGTMFVGRIGLLTMAFALAKRVEEPVFRYAEENVMVG